MIKFLKIIDAYIKKRPYQLWLTFHTRDLGHRLWSLYWKKLENLILNKSNVKGWEKIKIKPILKEHKLKEQWSNLILK
jgi:hypothetical protein